MILSLEAIYKVYFQFHLAIILITFVGDCQNIYFIIIISIVVITILLNIPIHVLILILLFLVLTKKDDLFSQFLQSTIHFGILIGGIFAKPSLENSFLFFQLFQLGIYTKNPTYLLKDTKIY